MCEFECVGLYECGSECLSERVSVCTSGRWVGPRASEQKRLNECCTTIKPFSILVKIRLWLHTIFVSEYMLLFIS